MLLLNAIQHFANVFRSIRQVCHSYLEIEPQILRKSVKEPHAYTKEEIDKEDISSTESGGIGICNEGKIFYTTP